MKVIVWSGSQNRLLKLPNVGNFVGRGTASASGKLKCLLPLSDWLPSLSFASFAGIVACDLLFEVVYRSHCPGLSNCYSLSAITCAGHHGSKLRSSNESGLFCGASAK